MAGTANPPKLRQAQLGVALLNINQDELALAIEAIELRMTKLHAAEKAHRHDGGTYALKLADQYQAERQRLTDLHAKMTAYRFAA